MKKFTMLLALLVFIGIQVVNAQNRKITGVVTTTENGSTLPGVSVLAKGTTIGTITDIDGKYTLEVPENTKSLLFTFVGMKTAEVVLAASNTVDVAMEPDVIGVDEVVVTALGISREKKSLGYATQEVKGEMVNTVKSDNFMNSLSGKVSGVQIRKNTNMGGSTNVIIRGSKSLTGNNQVLYVVDGVPISNNMTNTTSQTQAGTGYDFGNAASDINPDDIESVNILKGSAASALYGSRAANGVVMITTKKGSMKKVKAVGVSVSSDISVGYIDKKTFIKYQDQYGGGYGQYYDGPGGYWLLEDINGDGVLEQIVPTTEDASYGAPFDNSLVYQWNALDPWVADPNSPDRNPNYMKATPWKAADNGPITFFEKPVTFNTTIAIDNSNEKGSYRLSYTHYNQDGMLPNAKLKKDNFLLNGNWKVTDKLSVNGSANFIKTSALGRNSTGYNDNIMGSFRQWFEVNVDIQEQKDAFWKSGGRNVTWNYADPATNLSPIYWDNPYWTRYKNFETDGRNRFIGYMNANYKFTDWMDVMARVSTDYFSELQEERRAIGSVAGTFGIGTGADGSAGRPDAASGYLRRDISSIENNYDLMLNINKDLTEDLNFKGTFGTSVRRTEYIRLISSTNGGLKFPNVYSLQNSIDPLPYSKELNSMTGTNSFYGSVSLGYKNFLFLDGTYRKDHSSTLPKDNAWYGYPSVTGSFIFSNVINQAWLSFGKFRLNYAQVGNDAGFDQLRDIYDVNAGFGGDMTSIPNTKRNPNLKPEQTKSTETGLEMYFLDKRAGFDLALYKTNSFDQIMNVAVSTATGYSFRAINAGKIENKGVELSINLVPVKTSDLRWEMNIMWAKNKNKVVELTEGITNLQLGSFQGGVTVNARVGHPYGEINGTDYTYANGQKVVNPANGRYVLTTTSNNNIGNMNPDWTGGIANTINYKGLALNFLIDIQKGGDIFSLDMYYGLATGLPEETAFTNDLGNPVRNTNATGGGIVNNGVNIISQTQNADGTVNYVTETNTSRIAASNYGTFGYARLPNSAFVYDASYVKLREVSLSYTIPQNIMQKTFIKSATIGLTGSNLWIIKKNMPHADPESGLGAGNLQGYSTGPLPTTRDFGFNIKLYF